MIFARYIGPKSFGNFIPGKVYQAMPGFSGSGAIDMECFHVDDETGKRLTIRADEELFKILDTVYAVVLKPILILERGQVVTIIGGDDDFFEVEIEGKPGAYFKSNMFEVLDSTNVTPGSYVLDTKSHQWVKVSMVDDNLNIAPEGQEPRPIMDFRFPVGSDGVQTEPFFKCINTEGLEDELTEGRMYRAESVDANRGLLCICNNQGNTKCYMMGRFDSEK